MPKNVEILRGSYFLKNVFILFYLIYSFTNCQDPTVGCTDLRATNFDVTVVKTNNTLCTYPNLRLKTNYVVGDSSLSFNTTYQNDLGQPFRIINNQMYLSDYQLVTADGTVFKTIDSLSLFRQMDTIKTLNSFALIGRNNGFDFPIGQFQGVGKTFSKLRFKLGLTNEVNLTSPAKMPTNHPLSTHADSTYITSEKTYIFNKLIIAKGVNFKDTLKLNITTFKDIELTKNIVTTAGFDAVIPLKINYLRLFDGINFGATENIIKEKIVNNSSNIFSIQ